MEMALQQVQPYKRIIIFNQIIDLKYESCQSSIVIMTYILQVNHFENYKNFFT